MAIVWEKQAGPRRYEVRRAGRTVRLYTDGVFHTQYNPVRPVGSGVWDLLMLPAFFYPSGTIRRVLVLGVGGGAVIRLLQRFVAPERIVGVDLDPVHLDVARSFFGVDPKRTELHRADARDWLAAYRGAPFDLIIEDLFGEEHGAPRRAVKPNGIWYNALLKHLAPEGALVMNFISPEEMSAAAWFTNRRVRTRLPTAFRLASPREENAVAVFLRRDADSRTLRRNLARHPELDPRPKTARLRYRIRRL